STRGRQEVTYDHEHQPTPRHAHPAQSPHTPVGETRIRENVDSLEARPRPGRPRGYHLRHRYGLRGLDAVCRRVPLRHPAPGSALRPRSLRRGPQAAESPLRRRGARHRHARVDRRGGLLEIRDREALRLKENSWAAWAKVTPAHQRFLETLMRYPAHLIVTLRAKTVTEQVKNEKTGKTEVVDLGLFPQQRSDGEEFAYGLDISGRLDPEDQEVLLPITNTRYQAWHGAVFANPDEALGVELAAWLHQGVGPAVARPDESPSTTPPAATEDQAPPPEPSPAPLKAQDHPRPAEATMTRGQLLNTISTELFRQVRARGDAGRRQRVALLEACFGQPTMGEVATL